MDHVDVYFFPDFWAGNPAGQVSSCHSFMSQHGVKYGMLWFDIEGPGVYWSGTCSSNQAFLSTAVATAKSLGISVGIYSSASQWDPIMCGSGAFSGLPIWYAHYDDNPSFSDWTDFGGWTSPAIKQYRGDGSYCGMGFDYNWYPSK